MILLDFLDRWLRSILIFQLILKLLLDFFVQTFGIIFNINDAILGLTLLAWGNSLGGKCSLRELNLLRGGDSLNQ